MRPIGPIYFDHQATTPIDERVVTAMMPFLRENFGNPHSSDHILGWRSSQAVDEAAAKVAALIGADADEIIFTSGATESNNLALTGIARGALSEKRKTLLVSAVEHKSILACARALARRDGMTVHTISVDERGELNLDHLESLLDDDVLLVSVMAVNNEVGSLQPLQEASRLCKRHGSLLHSDFAQAPTAIDLKNLSGVVDILSMSGHKLYGPKGIGVAYVRRDLQQFIEPLIYGGGQQRGIRSGTVPTALCVGMAAAADIISSPSHHAELQRIAQLRNFFVAKVIAIAEGIAINGPDLERRHPGNANLRFPGFSAQDILASLQPNLAASTGAACTSGIPEPSHVLRAIGLSAEQAEASIRFSIGRKTTESEIDTAANLISASLAKLSSTGEARTA